MNVAIVYVYAPAAGVNCENYLFRFLKSYNDFPPGVEHETIVVLNGARATSEITCLFSSLTNCSFIEHDNSGYDIGAFQCAAKCYPCDMMVFFGSSTYFQWAGWLSRMKSVFLKYGNAQYGAMGNRGNVSVGVWPHIRTTAFWMNPKLMNDCPNRVTRPDQRHPFEHGKDCFTEWVKSQGLNSWVVTRTQELLWKDWDNSINGYSKGNQSNMLAGDRMTERPYFKSNQCGHPAARGQFCYPWTTENCWECLSVHP